MNDLNVIFSKNPKCLVRKVGDGLVIMPPEGEVTHTLGPLECFIWDQYNGTNDQQSILSAMLEQYDVQEDIARKDLLDFSAQLLAMNLIQTS